MAQGYNFDGSILRIPGAYVKTTIQNAVSGLSVTGILMIVGEATIGPDYTLEDDIDDVTYGPDQQADIIAKYGSGPLVDAFRGAVAAADDPAISGSFNRIILAKTNAATKATNTLAKLGGGIYGSLYDQSYGKAGNFISYLTEQKTAESPPTTEPFTWLLSSC